MPAFPYWKPRSDEICRRVRNVNVGGLDFLAAPFSNHPPGDSL